MRAVPLLFLASAILISVSCDVDFNFPSDNPCIRLQGNFDLNLVAFVQPLPVSANIPFESGTVRDSASHCDDGSNAVLDIVLDSNVTMTFTFTKLENTSVSMSSFITFIPEQVFNETSETTLVSVSSLHPKSLPAPQMSYQCLTGDDPVFMNASATANTSFSAVLSINKIIVQAFEIQNGTFSPAEFCQASQTSEGPTSNGPTSNGATSHEMTSPTPSSSTPTPGSPPRNQYYTIDKGMTCIVLDAGMELVIPYKSNGKTVSKTIGIPSTAESTRGACDTDINVENLIITFYGDWQIGFIFEKTTYGLQLLGASEGYYLQTVSISYNLTKSLFPDADNVDTANSSITSFQQGALGALIGGNYKCDTPTVLALQHDVTLKMYDLQYMAYNSDNSTAFNTNSESSCHAASPSTGGGGLGAGAIVGIVLACAVVFGIVGFCVYRRQKNKMYEQVY